MIIFSWTSFLLFVIFFGIFAFWYYQRVGRMAYYLAKCPGFPTLPFLGNVTMITGGVFRRFPPNFTVLTLELAFGFTLFFEELYVFWVGWNPIISLYKPELVEVVLSSNKLIEKPNMYDLLHPWLGRGLVTNKGNSWRTRRKLLTSAFHFNIINEFIPLMSEQSLIFVHKIKKLCGQAVDISPLVTACTLDIICETAMGVKIKAQTEPNTEYVKAVYHMSEAIMKRYFNPKGWFDFIFHRTAYGKQYLKSLQTLHDFSRKVIKERKQKILNQKESEPKNNIEDRKKMAFLDLLLEHHLSSDSQMTEEDIREEVDTFMFGGQDTTSTAICWSLHLIGLDQEVQEKVHQEIQYVFGDDKTRAVTGSDIKQLKYLECCIKEALRLFPSVPAFGRIANEDFKLSSYVIPKGTTIIIHSYVLHRNKNVFPQPEVYRPERFIESTASQTRINPYSYIPFSAGPRNCIGQRFAMIEEKIILANLFRNFTIKSMDYRDKVSPATELVTRPHDSIRLQFYAK